MALRVVSAGLVATVGGIHGYLWADAGYRHVATVGWMFLALTIGAGLAALSLLVTPRRGITLVAGGSALLAAVTIGGLIISVNVGLFGFRDSLRAPLAVTSLIVEAAAVAACAWLGVRHRQVTVGSADQAQPRNPSRGSGRR